MVSFVFLVLLLLLNALLLLLLSPLILVFLIPLAGLPLPGLTILLNGCLPAWSRGAGPVAGNWLDIGADEPE